MPGSLLPACSSGPGEAAGGCRRSTCRRAGYQPCPAVRLPLQRQHPHRQRPQTQRGRVSRPRRHRAVGGGRRHGWSRKRRLCQPADRRHPGDDPRADPASALLHDVRHRLDQVHIALQSEATGRGEGSVIASTVVALLAHGAHYACVWAGDSRIYRYRDRALEQLTTDHSYVQTLVDQGVLAPEKAAPHPYANVVTRAVGTDETLDLEIAVGDLAEPSGQRRPNRRYPWRLRLRPGRRNADRDRADKWRPRQRHGPGGRRPPGTGRHRRRHRLNM